MITVAKFEYKADNRGVRKLANSAGVGRAAVQAANAGKSFAESIAPVGKTGVYKRSFEVQQVPVETPTQAGFETRAGAILRNTAPHSLPVEGSHRVLRRTVDGMKGV